MTPRRAVAAIALFLCQLCPALAGAQTLTILHLNDFHGALEPTRTAADRPEEGGAARLAALVASERTRETALGDLVADVMREASGADVALVNGGTIRAGIPAGPVTVGTIYNVLPFDNWLISFAITGKELREARGLRVRSLLSQEQIEQVRRGELVVLDGTGRERGLDGALVDGLALRLAPRPRA